MRIESDNAESNIKSFTVPRLGQGEMKFTSLKIA